MNEFRLHQDRILIILLALLPIFGFSQNNGVKFMEVLNIKDLHLNEKQLATVEVIKADLDTKAVFGLQIDKISNVVRSSKGILSVKMPGSVDAFVAFPKDFKYSSDDDFSWYGEFEKVVGDLMISCKDGETFGRISIGAQVYQFWTLDKEKIILVEYDMVQLNRFGDTPTLPSVIQNPIIAAQAPSGPVNITVLVLYTQKAKDYCTSVGLSISSHAQLAKNGLQAALINSVNNSSITINVSIDAVALTSNFPENYWIPATDVATLRNSSYAQGLRNSFQSDIVVLMTDARPIGHNGYRQGTVPDTIAIAGIVYSLEQPVNNDAYAIVEASKASVTLTFAHEIGHLLACDHQATASPTQGYSFSIGSNVYRTIMHTPILNQVSERIQYFSTADPNIKYPNSSGHIVGDNDHNNAWKVRISAPIIRDFRTQIYPLAFVSGPSEVGTISDNTWTANISGFNTPYTIQWNYSLDGVDYSGSLGSNLSIKELPPFNNGYLFLKLTVKKGNTETAVDFRTVHLNPNGPIVIKPRDNNLNTLKSGITESGIGIEKTDSDPSSISIFPNPVSESTTIQYYLEKPCFVKIDLVDLSGQTVKTIQDGQQSIGNYKIKLGPSGISPGIYFCTAKIGDALITKKIVIE